MLSVWNLLTFALLLGLAVPGLAEWRYEETDGARMALIRNPHEGFLGLQCPKKENKPLALGVWVASDHDWNLDRVTYGGLAWKRHGWARTAKNEFSKTSWKAVEFLLETWNDDSVEFTFWNRAKDFHYTIKFDTSGTRESISRVMRACNYDPDVLLQMGNG